MAVRDDKLGWLVRDPNNTVRGPFTHTEISQFLKKRALRPKTELAQANSYWFAIEEKTELDRFFSDTPVVEPETQDFTSTLTESFIEKNDSKVELTQFVVSPLKQSEAAAAAAGTPKAEWLSDEYAEEFGLAIDPPESSTPPIATAKVLPTKVENAKPAASSSKKDSRDQNIVTMATAQVAPPAAIEQSLEQEVDNQARKLAVKWIVIGVVLVSLIGLVIFSFRSRPSRLSTQKGIVKSTPSLNLESTLRRAFLFSDLELAKSITAEFSSSGVNEYLANLSSALIKKNFLVDLDGALLNLNTARGLASDARSRAEIDNQIAVFNADKDILNTSTHLKLALDAAPGESIYRFNLALAEFIAGDPEKAEADLAAANESNTEKLLYSDILTLRGWVADTLKKSDSEALFKQALDIQPYNSNALLLMATHKLQAKSFREAEAEFRKFIDCMPDLDSFHLENFRKISTGQLVERVRVQIRAATSMSSSARTLPATMAADALLSANQNKLTEADKILDAALTSTPGNIDLLKARAYLRWKEAKYDEIVELLKDLPRDQRTSFGYNLLLGMAYAKMGKYSQAIRSFQVLTDIDPERSEAWSLYGDAQLHLKQNIEAKQNFQRALTKDPTDLRALQGLFNLGDEKVLENPSFAKLLPF